MNGYVLAGGLSARMGTDKARLPHDDLPMAVHLAGLLASVGLTPILVRRVDDGLPWIFPDGRPVRVLYEPDDGPRHPLRGVLAAFDDDPDARSLVIVPCDLPALTATAVQSLLAGPCVAAGHPLIAHLPAALRDRAAQLVRDGGPARALSDGLQTVELPAQVLVDRNEGGGPWPGDRLRARFGWLPPAGLARILAGERARQRARGVLDPSLVDDG